MEISKITMPGEWHYFAKGNANILFQYTGSNDYLRHKLLRLRLLKEDEQYISTCELYDFIELKCKHLFPKQIIDIQLVVLTRDFVDRLDLVGHKMKILERYGLLIPNILDGCYTKYALSKNCQLYVGAASPSRGIWAAKDQSGRKVSVSGREGERDENEVDEEMGALAGGTGLANEVHRLGAGETGGFDSDTEMEPARETSQPQTRGSKCRKRKATDPHGNSAATPGGNSNHHAGSAHLSETLINSHGKRPEPSQYAPISPDTPIQAVVFEIKPKWLYDNTTSRYCRTCSHNQLRGFGRHFCPLDLLYDSAVDRGIDDLLSAIPQPVSASIEANHIPVRQLLQLFLNDRSNVFLRLKEYQRINNKNDLIANLTLMDDVLPTLLLVMTLRDVGLFIKMERYDKNNNHHTSHNNVHNIMEVAGYGRFLVTCNIYDLDLKSKSKYKHWLDIENKLQGIYNSTNPDWRDCIRVEKEGLEI